MPSCNGWIQMRRSGNLLPTPQKDAKTLKNDMLEGKRVFPIVTKGINWRYQYNGYVKVAIRDANGKILGDERVRVKDIANKQWKDSKEKCNIEGGWDPNVEWQCVESPHNNLTMVRCIADYPYGDGGVARMEIIWLKRES